MWGLCTMLTAAASLAASTSVCREVMSDCRVTCPLCRAVTSVRICCSVCCAAGGGGGSGAAVVVCRSSRRGPGGSAKILRLPVDAEACKEESCQVRGLQQSACCAVTAPYAAAVSLLLDAGLWHDMLNMLCEQVPLQELTDALTVVWATMVK